MRSRKAADASATKSAPTASRATGSQYETKRSFTGKAAAASDVLPTQTSGHTSRPNCSIFQPTVTCARPAVRPRYFTA
ncbi:MAG: hypothetical protein AB1730_19305 [Myxococcota bacterium]